VLQLTLCDADITDITTKAHRWAGELGAADSFQSAAEQLVTGATPERFVKKS